MPLHFAVKFLNLETASFITLLGLSSPEKNHEESVGTRDSLARKYEKKGTQFRDFVLYAQNFIIT